MESLHYIQMQILKELLFKSNATFKDLNIKNLDTEHISYHLRKLRQTGLIFQSEKGKYNLTTLGKQFAADIDVDKNKIEERAKLSVLCIVTRQHNEKKKILVIRRKKAPLKGTLCFIAGKIRYGDSAEETAKREVLEESGIKILNPQFLCFFR